MLKYGTIVTKKEGRFRMKERLTLCFLMTVFILCTMSGCGQKASPQVSNTEVVEDVNQQELIPSGDVELTVWGAAEDAELLAEIVKGFEAEYAGKAQFHITIAAESESTCKDTLLSDVEGGADVFAFVDDQLRAMVAAGALIPIENADEVKSSNVEGAVGAASLNGTLYAYPMTADNGYFMYYNKAYFSEEDVTTLDGMLAVAAGSGKKVTMDWSSGWYLYSFFGRTGLTVGLNEDGITNYCTWNDNNGAIKGVDVAQAMLEIAANPGFKSTTSDEFLAGVSDGTIIAGVSGVWDAVKIEEAWGENYAAVKLPTYTCAGQQIQMASFSGYKMVGANAYSKQPYWALKLAEWISNEQNQKLRFERRSQGPSNINAAASPEVMSSPAIQAVLAQSEYASLQRIGGAYWDPTTAFGLKMAAGNPGGEQLELVLEKLVEKITAAY